MYKGKDLLKSDVKICTRCIYDESVYGIFFDPISGICNYCYLIDTLIGEYGTGKKKGLLLFENIVNKMKKDGAGKPYDVAVGVSGGTDSSYLLHIAKTFGLRPLAVHYDNTWNSAIATENIRKVTTKLGIDLYTHVCDNKESDDIFKSFLYAGVPEIDGPTDIALAEVLYRAASKYKIRYIFEGHSFIAEGVSPLGKAYIDGKYIIDIHKKYGRLPMKTFPNMSLVKFLYWTAIKRIKKIRPFWYLNYSKEDARIFLENEFGWKYYGGHHLENRMTAFHHSFYTPNRFGLDQRNNSLSASVRNDKITREDALNEYAKPPLIENELIDYVLKRFDMSKIDFKIIMDSPKKYYTDYKTYKKTFEILRPLFYLLAITNLVPMSFYLKYCFPAKVN